MSPSVRIPRLVTGVNVCTQSAALLGDGSHDLDVAHLLVISGSKLSQPHEAVRQHVSLNPLMSVRLVKAQRNRAERCGESVGGTHP